MYYTQLPEATNFDGMEKKIPAHRAYECPKCHGYGGWNLRINAYGPGKHFQAGCSQCNGWGFVTDKENAYCIHEYKELNQEACNKLGISHMGSCWHVYECTKCRTTLSVDSSD